MKEVVILLLGNRKKQGKGGLGGGIEGGKEEILNIPFFFLSLVSPYPLLIADLTRQSCA